MTLQEIKIASYLMTSLSNDEKSYRKIAMDELNLGLKKDQKKILKFLNEWGCRQFAIEYHDVAAKSLQNWFKKFEQALPKYNQKLIHQSEKKIKSYETLFDELMNSDASTKICNNKDIVNHIGPVGAAKTLFAIRKHSFPPWDNPIIKKLKISKNGAGYCDYLLYVKKELLKLEKHCNSINIDIMCIPSILNREHASLVKIVDEYLWLTITQACEPSKIIELCKSTN